MIFGKQMKLVTVLTVAVISQFFTSDKLLADKRTDKAFTIIGLTANNTLVRFGYDSRKPSKPIPVTGIDGNLQGIDFRPADGLLYGLTDTDNIYTIDPDTGYATHKSTLSNSFDGGFQSGFDFNPVVDRLRLAGSNDQNFSVNVDDGAVTVQTNLAYNVDGDPNNGANPNITAAAYTNSFRGAPSTQLFDIDYDRDVLVLQNPPASGSLRTIGYLGINFAPIGGFDIFTDGNGVNTAFALSGSTLYTIDLNTGAATELGKLGRGGFIGLAVTSSKR